MSFPKKRTNNTVAVGTASSFYCNGSFFKRNLWMRRLFYEHVETSVHLLHKTGPHPRNVINVLCYCLYLCTLN